jgi:multidrug efflux pump subunit AcrA (membrane-fusion protein)
MSKATLEKPREEGGTPVLRLPNLGDEGQPGASFVKRSVSLTLWTLAAVTGIAVAVACLVSMDVTVKGSGTLEPVRIWTIRAQEAGAIRAVFVQTGDTVAKGDSVLSLDGLQLRSTLSQLEAQYRAAGIDLRRAEAAAPVEHRQQDDRVAQARARLVTTRAALRQRMIENDLGANVDSLLAVYRPGSHVGIDLAVGEVRSAEADLRLNTTQSDVLDLERFDRERKRTEETQLASQIETTRERLRRLTAVSPTRGVVLTEQIERLPGTFVREGDVLAEVADLDQWRATIFVAERDVHKIRLGDSVHVEVQAFSTGDEKPLRGSVVYVAPEPMGAQGGAAGSTAPSALGSGLYRVVARLDHQQLAEVGIDKFRRGYTVEGKVVTRRGRIIKLLWDYLNDKMRGRA